jgi:hypothetical protein
MFFTYSYEYYILKRKDNVLGIEPTSTDKEKVSVHTMDCKFHQRNYMVMTFLRRYSIRPLKDFFKIPYYVDCTINLPFFNIK